MRLRFPLVALGTFVVACSSGPAPVVSAPAPVATTTSPTPPPRRAVVMPVTTATATLRDLAGAPVGTVTFTDSYSGVIVQGSVSGLGLGAHAVHIHSVGKCESPFTSTGPHFNPEKKNHGFRHRDGPHLGDMPNIDMPAAGRLKFEYVLRDVTVNGPNALVGGQGTSIVIHSNRDDYLTDPSGESGGPLACGVIIKKP